MDEIQGQLCSENYFCNFLLFCITTLSKSGTKTIRLLCKDVSHVKHYKSEKKDDEYDGYIWIRAFILSGKQKEANGNNWNLGLEVYEVKEWAPKTRPG